MDRIPFIFTNKFIIKLFISSIPINYYYLIDSKNLSTFSNSIPIIQQKLFGLTEYFLCISCDVNGPVKITHDFHRDTNTPYPYTRIEIHNKKLFSQVCRLITDNDKFSEIINNNIVLIGAEVVEKVLTNRPNKRWNFIYFSNKNINLPVYVIAIVIE